MTTAALCGALCSTPGGAKTIFERGFNTGEWVEQFHAPEPPPKVVGKERGQIVNDEELAKTVLKVLYPAKKWSSENSGVQWKTRLKQNYESLTVSYSIKFEEGFNFVKGGKLPGLIGGHQHGKPESTATGGYRPDGTDGWSARMMWRRGGKLVQYLYHMHQKGKNGDDLPWMIDGQPVTINPGEWHRVKTEITMNDIGHRNGSIRSWFDDQLALEVHNVEFRTVPELAIDTLYFSTFFGGSGSNWAPKKNEYISYDDFVIETGSGKEVIDVDSVIE